jgi:hypothetical protein
MELILIKIGSPEWDFMWKWLEQHPINKGIEEPSTALNEGEAWQYMGSWQQGDRAIHSFRHRNHPVTKSIQNVSVHASELLTPDQIEKTLKK